MSHLEPRTLQPASKRNTSFVAGALSAVPVVALEAMLFSSQPAQSQSTQEAVAGVAIPASPAPQLVLQSGHTSFVYALAIAPRGNVYATGDDNGVVKVWTRPKHELLWSAGDAGQRINTLLFSPDGQKLLAQGEAGLEMWTVSSGQVLWQKPTGNDNDQVTFSPDGRTLTTIDSQGERALFDVATGNIKNQSERVNDFNISRSVMAISPDGRALATGAPAPFQGEVRPKDSTVGLIWNTSPVKLQQQLKIPRDDFITALEFSPDNSLLAVGVRQNLPFNGAKSALNSRCLAKIFDAHTGLLKREFVAYSGTGQNARINSVEFAPGNGFLLTRGEDDNGRTGQSSFKVWNLKTGTLHRTFADDSGVRRFLGVWASPTQLLFSSTRSNSSYCVEEAEISTGQTRPFFAPTLSRLSSPSWSPDGRFLVASGGVDSDQDEDSMTVGTVVSGISTLRVWSRETGNSIVPPWKKEPTQTTITERIEFGGREAYSHRILSDAGAGVSLWRWTPDSQTLITDSRKFITSKLETWHWPSGPRVSTYTPPPSPVLPPNAHAKQRADHEAQIQAFQKSPNHLEGEVVAMEASRDNRTIAIGTVNADLRFASASDPGSDGMLALWDARTGAFTGLERGPDVRWLAFSPDGKWLAARSSPSLPVTATAGFGFAEGGRRLPTRIDVWNVATLTKVASRATEDNVVGWKDNTGLMFCHQTDLNGTATFVLQSWSFAKGAVTPLNFSLEHPYGQQEPVIDVQNGLLRVRTSEECRWFSLSAFQDQGCIPAEGPVFLRLPAMSPDGALVALETGSGTIELWHPAREKQQARLAATIALLPSATGQTPGWIAWTPDGFYDGSANAFSWVHWRQNGHLLPANTNISRRRVGLLRQLAPLTSPRQTKP